MSSNSGNQTFSVNSPARGAIVTRKKTTGLSTTLAMGREKTSSAPYRLRDTSKLPSRYRDDDLLVPATRVKSPVKTRSPSKNSTPSGSPARRAIGRTPGISSISTPKTATGSIDDEAQNIQTILDNSLKTDYFLFRPISVLWLFLVQVINLHCIKGDLLVPRIIDDSFGNTPESSQSSLVENDYPTSEAARSIILRKIARKRKVNSRLADGLYANFFIPALTSSYS
uniref:Uncharacterized protein n=1 Tax=Heterorhabditis bacteriophora TaxID=37862 RepID=A0A1I7X4V1_HETBA